MEIVNGYSCRDCTDVSYAKKNIDPAHPKDGPQPTSEVAQAKALSEAVQFGGLLADLSMRRDASPQIDTRPDGPRLNILA